MEIEGEFLSYGRRSKVDDGRVQVQPLHEEQGRRFGRYLFFSTCVINGDCVRSHGSRSSSAIIVIYLSLLCDFPCGT